VGDCQRLRRCDAVCAGGAAHFAHAAGAWKASCRRPGIASLRFRNLRHEAGSRKLEAGYPMHAVALWLRHTDLTTTVRYLNADIGQLHALNDRPVPPVLRGGV
jgi:integrase